MNLEDLTSPYRVAQIAALAVAILFMIQTVVGAIARVRTGQRGGFPVDGGPRRFVFRADRARANTYEVLGVFGVALLVAMTLGAQARMVNVGAAVFATARLLHMTAYYANLSVPRTICFIGGNIGIGIVLVASVRTAL